MARHAASQSSSSHGCQLAHTYSSLVSFTHRFLDRCSDLSRSLSLLSSSLLRDRRCRCRRRGGTRHSAVGTDSSGQKGLTPSSPHMLHCRAVTAPTPPSLTFSEERARESLLSSERREDLSSRRLSKLRPAASPAAEPIPAPVQSNHSTMHGSLQLSKRPLAALARVKPLECPMHGGPRAMSPCAMIAPPPTLIDPSQSALCYLNASKYRLPSSVGIPRPDASKHTSLASRRAAPGREAHSPARRRSHCSIGCSTGY